METSRACGTRAGTDEHILTLAPAVVLQLQPQEEEEVGGQLSEEPSGCAYVPQRGLLRNAEASS